MRQKHRGKILEFAVKTSDIPHGEVAKKLGKDRRTLSNYYKKDDLSWDVIIKVGEIIKYDFSKDFPEQFGNIVKEPQETYGKKISINEEVLEQKAIAQEWKDKYHALLETHNKTLAELNYYIKVESKKTSQKRPNDK